MQQNAASLETKGMLADPGDHFKGRFEVERKFQVDDLPSVLERLKDMAAIPFTIGNTETDVFLDLADARLESNNQFHTLRHMQPSDRVLWISKGPAKDECIAMDLPDFDKALAMLKSLGFEEKWHIKKRRDIYFVDKFHVTLDHIEGLGSFVEIAIMTDDQSALSPLREDVQSAADQLGLVEYPEVHLSYRELLHG
ncbi:adenylate cyclase, class 2 [Cohaesibacter sp. ES.047]|uniref:class IV adenylate cyclase n=1 Tax=Cohaesibacter sp. ES.047 TaxID=1798205 RepID=UPI000BB74061|nr:class IV adenylate cyclase [Cohaesibacter sp. ES.047]SNY91049.1 adenylate cyclase, class 2 [Cohaesibacter sp. ES.047]